MEKINLEDFITQADTFLEPEKPEADLDAEKVQPEKKKRGRPRKIKTKEQEAPKTPETPETVDMSKPESPTIIVEPAAAPEFSEYEHIHDETKSLVREVLGREIEKDKLPEVLRSLGETIKKIELDISKKIDGEEKQKLLEMKKSVSNAIIEIASEGEGRDLREDIKKEEQKQYEINLPAGRTEEGHKAVIRDKYYNEIIQSGALSKKQQKELMQGEEILVSRWPGTLSLNREQIAACIKMGIDPLQSKYEGWPRTTWFKGWLPGKSDKIMTVRKIRDVQTGAEVPQYVGFKNKEDFTQYLSSTGQKDIETEVQQKFEQRKNQVIQEGGIADYTRDKKTKEIVDSLFEKTPEAPIKPLAEIKESLKDEYCKIHSKELQDIPVDEKEAYIREQIRDEMRGKNSLEVKPYSELETDKEKTKAKILDLLKLNKLWNEANKSRGSAVSNEIIDLAFKITGHDYTPEAEYYSGFLNGVSKNDYVRARLAQMEGDPAFASFDQARETKYAEDEYNAKLFDFQEYLTREIENDINKELAQNQKFLKQAAKQIKEFKNKKNS